MSNQVGFTGLVDGPRRWDILSALMLEQGYQTFVEVGCKEGRTTGHILHTVPEAMVTAIDPWAAQDGSKDETRETYKDWDFAEIERQFWKNVGEHKDRCDMFRQTSDRFAKIAAETSQRYDIVFIDALHDHASVKQDISLWWPLVRCGGILAGHDFNHKWPGVERAVAESFDLMHIGIAPDSVWFIIKASEEQFRG